MILDTISPGWLVTKARKTYPQALTNSFHLALNKKSSGNISGCPLMMGVEITGEPSAKALPTAIPKLHQATDSKALRGSVPGSEPR